MGWFIIPIHPDYQSEYNAMIKKYGSKKGKSVFYATMKKQGLDYTKPRPKKKEKEIKHSFLNGLAVKEKEGNLIVEGYVATDHIDNSHLQGEGIPRDKIPKTSLQKIVDNINRTSQGNKLSLHHDREESVVAGVMKNAQLKQTDDGHWGVWVEATVNPAYPEYDALAKEIEIGTIDGFSIEYETVSSHPQVMNLPDGTSTEVRILDDINIYGAGFASRAVNPNAQITSHTYKELINIPQLKNKSKEMVAMTEVKEEEKPEEEAPAEEEKPAEEESQDSEESKEKEEKPEEEKAEEESSEESSDEEEKELKAFRKWKTEQKALKVKEHQKIAIKEALKEMYPESAPRFETGDNLANKEFNAELKEIKSTIDNYKKATLECKEWKAQVNSNKDDGTPIRSADINVQLKEAARLHNELRKMYPRGIQFGPERMGQDSIWDGYTDPGFGEASDCGLASQSFEVKESHWKALETKANPMTTTTNRGSTYYVAAPEMADIYDPVIYNMMNDKTTAYGLFRKVDGSKYSYEYGWRAIYGRATVDGGLAEGATTITPDSTDRIRLKQPFKFYYAAVRLTGPAIASAKASGGVGDLMALEVKDQTRALLRDINDNLLTGTEDGSNDGNEALGLTYLCEKGTSYTDLYQGVSRNTYKLEGNSESASSANITKGRLRKGIRACVAGDTNLQANNGGTQSSADPSDLLIITHHIQKDKILALFDDAQRFNSVSAKAGFVGLPTFDGIPIHADNQCTSSVLFIVDMRHTFLVVQVPPTFTAWGREYAYDLESGFIKTYFNLVCTKPGNNYMCTSLATT